MKKLFSLLFLCFVLTACGGNNASQDDGDYEKTKKMVVDILQTEDGKKALTEILQDEKLKQELVIQSDEVKSAINEVLISDKGKEMWKNLFQDPSFVEGYTKSIKEEQIKLQKDLMSDAEYQKQMLELLQNPEVSTLILSLMKSQQFRAHLEETIQQTLETPLFKAKIQETLLKAAEEQQSKEGGGGSSQESTSEGSGGGGQGGGGGGSGGDSGGGP
ncbi:spore germination lipoprotein GerD [Oceanobacillus sp. FSL H7-0719]|uniref:spore germination lipoprotein GerD n=1 Tax=Oceanobacillus sp. FSL H7-0719 TaxID=2954507 RepID=UPI003249172E